MKIWDWIFPRRCLLCRCWNSGTLCSGCEVSFPWISSASCVTCARPFEGAEKDHLCGDCLEKPAPFERLLALGIYRGGLHDLIGRLKYQGEERIALYFGDWLAEKIQKEANPIDLIIPVPLHPKRLRQRGFNQSARLAQRLAKRLKLDWDPLLVKRVRETPSQTGLSAEERGRNLKNAFAVGDEGKLEGERVLLVDDVYTTGATLRSCAKLLKSNGVESLAAAVIARAV